MTQIVTSVVFTGGVDTGHRTNASKLAQFNAGQAAAGV
jgi:hypothetical protein